MRPFRERISFPTSKTATYAKKMQVREWIGEDNPIAKTLFFEAGCLEIQKDDLDTNS
jgi:hypothetical protein